MRLGVTVAEPCAIDRTQFGVLRRYERVMQMFRIAPIACRCLVLTAGGREGAQWWPAAPA